MEGLIETGLEVAGKATLAAVVTGLSVFGIKKTTKYVGETGESFMETAHKLKRKALEKKEELKSKNNEKENDMIKEQAELKAKNLELENEKLKLELQLARLNTQPTAVKVEKPETETVKEEKIN